MKRALVILALLVGISWLVLWAATTNWTDLVAANSWTDHMTASCPGGASCTAAYYTSDTAHADTYSYRNLLSTKGKTWSGYWSRAISWQTMGVAAGNVVQSVTGSTYYKFLPSGAGACTTASGVGMDIFDSGNSVEAIAAPILSATSLTYDSAWHQSTGSAQNVGGSYQASGTTVTLRWNVTVVTGSTTGMTCEGRVDEYALTITNVTPSGKKGQVIVARFDGQGNFLGSDR